MKGLISLRLVPLALVILACLPVASSLAQEPPPRTPADLRPPAGKSEIFPYPVEREVLPNGLKILMIPMPSEGLVSYWSIVRTGSRDEVEKGVTGFAHFFEHIMFRGSQKYPGPVYNAIVTAMGADSNASTTDDLTNYHLSITKADLPQVIEIESDRFQNLSYSEEEFKTEAGAVYGEYRKSHTDPFEVLFEAIQNAAFDRHTYKHTTIGFEKDIEQMPKQYVYSKSFFQRFYRPENVVILVAGDFDPSRTLDLIRKVYGAWKPGYVEPGIPVEPPQSAQRRIDVPFDGKSLPILAVAFKGERLQADDRTMVAATLIADLAFGETSELYKKLVLEEQRLESLDTDFGFNRDPGLWSVFALVKDPGDVAAVEGEIWAAVSRFQRERVDQARLSAAISRRTYRFLSGLSTPEGVANRLLRLVALTGDVKVIDQLYSTYDAITPEDIQRAAQLFLRPERSTVATLHTKEQAIPEPATVEAPVLLPVPDDPNVTLRIWFKVGSQNDPPGKEGLAALTAEMIGAAGTVKLPYDEILGRLFPLAASYGVSVDKEMTVMSGLVHRDLVQPFYSLFVDSLLSPGFRRDDFERLRDQGISTIEKQLRYSSDEELGKAALIGKLFDRTPYSHLDSGTVEGLKTITLDDVKAFYKTYYTRDNVVIGLGGAYDPALRSRLIADLSRLPAGTPPPVAASAPQSMRGRHVLLVQKPGASTAISLGFPIDLHRGSREFYALWIANSWLGEHRNSASHLYQVIREARGMNYGDYSYIEAFPGGGGRNMPPTGVGRRQQIFEIWIRPVPQNRAIFALRAALRELERLSRNGMTKEQFDKTRSLLKKYSLQFATTTAERLGYAVDDRFYSIESPGHLARFRKMMDEITFEEVNSAIRKYLQADDMVIAMVTADGEATKRALVSDRPTPIDYEDIKKPRALLEEDKEIERYPLRIEERNVEIVPVDRMFAK